MKGNIEENIKLLKMLGYDSVVTNHSPLELEETHEGLQTFRYLSPQGNSVYIHSQYNMKREFESTINKEEISKKDALYIVYGLGLGYHIKELLHQISSRSILFVIEPNMDIVSTYMHTQDFSEIVAGNTFYFFGTEDEIITKLNQKLFAFNVMPLFGNLTNVILPSYQIIYGDWIEKIQHQILDAIRHAYFMLGNDMEDTIIGIKNNFENIDVLIKSPSIEDLKNTYHDLPAIIVSAGPSLDKNIHQLKEAQGKALIIATDAVLSTLKKYDVVPDGVVSIERVLVTYEKFYKDKELNSKTVFIGPPVVRREIFETMKNNKKLICLKQGEKINEWMNNNILGEKRLLPMGTSCAHIAFSFAQLIGANPIIFIGQDLAYTKEGITHSNDVEISKRVNLQAGELTYVKSINGEMLPTNQAFKNFHTWFELQIAQDQTDRLYIDASEGGAYIEGTKIIPLQEVIDQFCQSEILPLYDNVPTEQDEVSKYHHALKEVEDLVHYFDVIRKEANRHILRLDKIQNKVIQKKKTLKKSEIEKVYKVLNQGKVLEDLILQNDIARTLFQAPLMMAATKVRMLGNEIEFKNIVENVEIQKRMVAAIILGSYSVMNALLDIITQLKDYVEGSEICE